MEVRFRHKARCRRIFDNRALSRRLEEEHMLINRVLWSPEETNAKDFHSTDYLTLNCVYFYGDLLTKMKRSLIIEPII